MDRNWRVLLIAGVISLCSAQFVFASYSLGDSGDAVKDLQRRLTQAGCLVRADGRFNETTVSAVKKFQKKHNLDVDFILWVKGQGSGFGRAYFVGQRSKVS